MFYKTLFKRNYKEISAHLRDKHFECCIFNIVQHHQTFVNKDCLARYLELMCFKLSQLSHYVCFCYGISVHEKNYDTSHRQKRFHTI